jgi:hypothetical protein
MSIAKNELKHGIYQFLFKKKKKKKETSGFSLNLEGITTSERKYFGKQYKQDIGHSI